MNKAALVNLLVLEVVGPLDIRSDSEFYILRKMKFADLDQVYRLEEQVFPTPWSHNVFEDELKNSWSLPLVVETHGKVIGYSISWIIADELHIANVAIAPEHRRNNISKQMMLKLMNGAAKLGLVIAHLEVRRSNTAALELYRKLGFQIVGVRKRYYEDDNEDALLMSCDLTNQF